MKHHICIHLTIYQKSRSWFGHLKLIEQHHMERHFPSDFYVSFDSKELLQNYKKNQKKIGNVMNLIFR